MKFTDETILNVGIHAGEKLKDVPDQYLLWLYENEKAFPALKEYIADNLEAIKANIEREKHSRNEKGHILRKD